MSLKNVSFAAIVCLFVLAAVAQATPINIADPGFEGTSGWTFSANPSGRTPAIYNPPGTLVLATHLGTSMGWMNPGATDTTGGWMGQLLKVGASTLHVNENDQISISLFQGMRSDQGAGSQDLRLRFWSDAIGGAGSMLQETAFSGSAPAAGWVERNATYTATASAVNKDLYIQLVAVTALTPQIEVDDVSGSYTATPEPGTLALLATGLIGLLTYAWRKRR